MKIEKIIDPAVDPIGAFEQTKRGFCSVVQGPWIVTGTNTIEEAMEFVKEFIEVCGDSI